MFTFRRSRSTHDRRSGCDVIRTPLSRLRLLQSQPSILIRRIFHSRTFCNMPDVTSKTNVFRMFVTSCVRSSVNRCLLSSLSPMKFFSKVSDNYLPQTNLQRLLSNKFSCCFTVTILRQSNGYCSCKRTEERRGDFFGRT